MRLEFRPITVEEYPLAEDFKRDTARALYGHDELFDVWFPAERSYASFLAKTQAFDPESCAFMLVDGEIVGGVHLCVRNSGDAGHMNNIYLKPAWRGQRLGDQLNAYALAYFNKHKFKYATLKTRPDQLKTIAFYERMGWRYHDDYETPHDTGIVMRIELAA